MNKILAIILSSIILAQSMSFDLCDIDKMPNLINHFVCHIKAGDSFSEFLDMHYGSLTKKHNGEHKEHEQLPFKHHQFDTHVQFMFVICNNNYPVKTTFFKNTERYFSYKEPFTKLFTVNFFQPPKYA